MKFKEDQVSGLVNILLGILFIIFKGGVIGIALTLLGVCAIALGIIDIVNKATTMGVIKAACGVAVIAFGWIFVSVALIFVSVALIVMGILRIIDAYKNMPVNATMGEKILSYAKPCVSILAGLCLIFNQGGVINGLFIVVGILLIIDGILSLSYNMKK